jgi:hypothetical protein
MDRRRLGLLTRLRYPIGVWAWQPIGSVVLNYLADPGFFGRICKEWWGDRKCLAREATAAKCKDPAPLAKIAEVDRELTVRTQAVMNPHLTNVIATKAGWRSTSGERAAEPVTQADAGHARYLP